jgi:flagellar biosynthetic protein FlhB
VPEDTSGGEKTEEPTPRKRMQSREEGQVAYSAEVNNAAVLLVGFGLLIFFGPTAYEALMASMRICFRDALTWELTESDNLTLLFAQQAGVIELTIGFMGALFLLALLLSTAQVGLQFTAKPLMPKWQRISPLAGLKRLFGLRGLMRFIFALLKLILIVSVATYVLTNNVPSQLYHNFDLRSRFAESGWLIILLALKLAGVLGVVAFFDFLYQRWQMTKDMMMTKQEVKEEFKQSDGDPMVKNKIRQIQRQMAQQRMMQEVPSADVVITNPTHVAVALRYDREEMGAPICVAKGYDLIAQRIKQIAAENNVIQVENVPLARALAKVVDVGKPIPVDFYQQVAEVLTHVYKLKNKTA